MKLSIGDKFYLFNANDIITDNKIKAVQLELVGLIDTDFSEYDKMIAFIPFKTAQQFFLSTKTKATGIISSVINPMLIDDLKYQLTKEFEGQSIYMSTWKDRHKSLISWLNIYDIPIKLIMLFIVLISVVQLTVTIWMIAFERKKQYAILKAVGFLSNDIKQIVIAQNFILSFSGCIIGLCIAFLLLLAQYKYHLVSLTSSIYFMNYLPVDFNLKYFILYPFLSIVVSLILSIYPAIKISKFKPSRCLSYE